MLNRRELIEAAIGLAGSQLLPPIPVPGCDCDCPQGPATVVIEGFPPAEPDKTTVRVDYVTFHKPEDSELWYCEMKWSVNDGWWQFTYGWQKERLIETTYVTVRWTDDGLEFVPQPLCDHLIAGRVQLF